MHAMSVANKAARVPTYGRSSKRLPSERFINPEDVANLIFNFYETPLGMNIEEILIRPFKGDIDN